MDTNKDRQSGFGDGEYGVNVERGCLAWLLALVVVVVLVASMGH